MEKNRNYLKKHPFKIFGRGIEGYFLIVLNLILVFMIMSIIAAV